MQMTALRRKVRWAKWWFLHHLRRVKERARSVVWIDENGLEHLAMENTPRFGGESWRSKGVTRADPEWRATWPEKTQAQEQVRWYELIALHGRSGFSAAWRRYHRFELRMSEPPGWRRARKIPSTVRRTIYEQWEAAGRTCGICGEVVAQDERTHIHHVVSVSRGGTQALDNLAVVHARCNLRLAPKDMWNRYYPPEDTEREMH